MITIMEHGTEEKSRQNFTNAVIIYL